MHDRSRFPKVFSRPLQAGALPRYVLGAASNCRVAWPRQTQTIAFKLTRAYCAAGSNTSSRTPPSRSIVLPKSSG